jgi:hypothetical protein
MSGTMSSPITRYLLDELPEGERERLEEEYFASDAVWDAVVEAENDLIDAYLRGGLSARDRAQFEAVFLSSAERRDRLELARSLIRVPRPEPTRPLALPRWAPRRLVATAACLSAAVIGGSVLLRNPPQSGPAVEVPALTRVDAPAVSVLLTPGSVRGAGGGGTQTVRVPAAPSSMRLVLDMRRDDFKIYNVVVRSVEGAVVHRVDGLESRPTPEGGRAVVVDLPSRVLATADYVVDLSGRSPSGAGGQLVDSYSFSASR